jgi:hypothetical protein
LFVEFERSTVIHCKEEGKDGLHEEEETFYPCALEVSIHQCCNQQFCSCHWLFVKTLHFREEVKKGTVSIYHVATGEQMADMLTKPFDETLFMKHGKKIMGW